MPSLENLKIAVIGLGYVGLPLAVEFGKYFDVVGYDISESRVAELKSGIDRTRETDADEIGASSRLGFSTRLDDIADCDIYIVTVPTPVDAHRRPDLSPLISASRAVGSVLSRGNIVVYESTVYPGATEEDCVPVLEATSGLAFGTDFEVGYSPERINPGDREHRLPTIRKVTSASSARALEVVDGLYRKIITAGTYPAASIRVAEAAKVIENTQRDVNIALINELSMIFERLGIDTLDVLEAAGTKWNFLPFRPGLVGGHCIGVDPYYLTHKAQAVGYHPEVVLAGRKINDGMGAHVAHRFIRALIGRNVAIKGAKVLVLGLTFKENCPDLRNSRVIDIIDELRDYGVEIDVFDPHADVAEAVHEYGITLVQPTAASYDGVIVAVGHAEFIHESQPAVHSYLRDNGPVFDVKGVLARDLGALRL